MQQALAPFRSDRASTSCLYSLRNGLRTIAFRVRFNFLEFVTGHLPSKE